MHEYVGQCPCGRVELWLFGQLAPAQFQPRSDKPTCRLCSEHDGVWISDPRGELRLPAADATTVRTFASEQVQFHFCSGCRTLAYASFVDVAVVRLALFESIRSSARPVVITNFETETVAAGRQRRLEKWTPVQRAFVRALTSQDGKRRVFVVDRGGGRFGYDEEYFSNHPDERCWVPLRQVPLTLCDSAESAEREARGRVDWLRDASEESLDSE